MFQRKRLRPACTGAFGSFVGGGPTVPSGGVFSGASSGFRSSSSAFGSLLNSRISLPRESRNASVTSFFALSRSQYCTSTPLGGFVPASMLIATFSPVGFSRWRYVTIVAPVIR
jgi:hypothetical protein